MDTAAEQRWSDWRKRRLEELSQPDSWLGLTGLYGLENGESTVGSAEKCAVQLPGGPELLGYLSVDGAEVCWRPVSGAAQILATDQAGAPSIVQWQNLAFFVVERGGKLAARVRDLAWAERQPFGGLTCFDYAPEWRIEADWRPLTMPLSMEISNVSGELKSVTVAYKAVFELDGRSFELLPISVSEKEVFFAFRDRSSGQKSYGAGRFLKAKPAKNGRIVLDFNRAFNPPCAFTPFATCPLPPPENWLPFPVAAGEMKYSGEH